ncbi:LysR family transcriptional regulator [Acinetobacter gerneri]|jgi:DNA-binding transcriptional LysR family regulator|uniref:LysR family transcriptional regulator n=1 Tax=Acinetobacter gerneri TaxID=202952 RepID=A0AAW8JFG4_9GAMM|nr:LysR family transcriptional regulator [Acinetobacter gerneri]MCH4244950.1 LysR family transcriptional regulator [Acinetobacter gerneri]MDQ9008924.1 LysR family transcriptional regulator [Acinetobacter gerneri]MDQ9013028.1 LysR family transcriptional regulator [Acinetobacter gerneri]MDQ9024334.1 LysR family transcriptional regulator [Acinetobacter gerneri]MDQ9051700.1 LysR family transcriptional regulator [Acinetobacter gerneri]
MNLAAFEAFVKVMETGSISMAADQLFITQPAVTKRIHSLEDYFGVKLFESAGRGVQATHAAHSLLPKVKNWLNELGDIHHTLSHEQGQVQGKLKIGTSHHIGLHHLPIHLKNYVQQYPDVTLDVHFVDSEQAHEQVLAGDLELAFLTLPPVGDDRLEYITIWNDPLVFVVSPFHPLAHKKNLSLEDLIEYPSLLPAAQTYTSQITLAEFEKQGLKPKITMSNNPLESIRMLVSIGLGWSVLPKTLLNQDLHQLEIQTNMNRHLGMVWHPARTQSRAVQELIEMMK